MKKFVVSVIVLLVLGAGAALANVFITSSPSAIYCPVCGSKDIVRVTVGSNYKYTCVRCGKIETVKIEEETVETEPSELTHLTFASDTK